MDDPAITTPRVTPEQVIVMGWQPQKGTAASATLQYFEKIEGETDWEIQPNVERIEPLGRNAKGDPMAGGDRQAFKRPGASIKHFMTSTLINMALESLFAGRPTTANGYITEAGDNNDFLSAWSLTGFRHRINSDANRIIYVTLTDEDPGADSAKVSLYMDAAKLNLVAEGSAVDGATATLTEQNNSGLSGTVLLASPITTGDNDITLTIKRIDFVKAFVYSDDSWLTIGHDTGGFLHKAFDQVCSRLKLTAADGGSIIVEADFVGLDYSRDGTTLTETLVDQTYMLAAEIQLTHDFAGSDTGPTILGLDNFSVEITPILTLFPTTGVSGPKEIVQEGWDWKIEATGKLAAELETMITNAQAITTNLGLRLRMTHATNEILNIDFTDFAWEPNNIPKLSGGKLDMLTIAGQAKADGATAAISAYYQWEA